MSTTTSNRGTDGNRRTTPLPDHLIYTVCERFLRKSRNKETGEVWTANTLARWLTEKKGYRTSREGIFPIVRQAIDRGFVVLRPPRVKLLFDQMAESYPMMPPDTRILDVKPEEVRENITAAAAERLLALIRDVGRAKSGLSGDDRRVHLGFGAGGTTLLVARRLALLMENESGLPPLTLHATTSGFDIKNPLSAPASFFPAFHDLNHSIRYVGLFAPAVVPTQQWESIRALPDIENSFLWGEKVDIVVTSLAQADDRHGLLNRFLNAFGGDKRKLLEMQPEGDVQFQPFSANGPIQVDTGIRAVTLFDLPDLVRLASTPGKHVLLLAGQCIRCGATKSRALRPLVSEPSLRVANHLITDAKTVQELLQQTPQSVPV